MKMIAAVDKNWGIGKDNDLLDSSPEDMKFFRETTRQKAVIMGKNTFLSFPNQKPLPNRLNVVMTSDKSFSPDGVTVVDSIEKAIEAAKKEYSDEDIFVIGGAAVYKQMEPLCDCAYITKIDNEYDADRFFPNLDEMPGWKVISEEKVLTAKGFYITFVTYTRG